LERDDLALDDREAEELLRIVGWSGPADRARALYHAFEGWAAGLYLAALNGRTAPESATPDDASAHRMVAAYVRSEVLGSLSVEQLDLVVRASAFEPLDASMIAEVLAVDGVEASLRDVARTTPLLVELDGPGTRYRWHRSLRAVVQAESSHQDPEAERLLQQRAAVWYEREGLHETALAYAMRATDAGLVARLLPGVAEAAWNAGRVAELTTWLDWFDAQDGPAGHPRVAMIGSLVHGLLGRSARALRWATLAQVDHASRIADGDAGLAALVRASLCRSGIVRMVDDAELAVALLPANDPWAPTARILHGVGLGLEGRRRSADAELAAGTELATAAGGSRTHAAIGLVFRAWLAVDRGEWRSAESLIRRARGIVRDAGLGEGAAGLSVEAMSARLAVRHGAFPQAMADARVAQRLRTTAGSAVPWLAVRTRLDLATALVALADPATAGMILGEAEELLRRQPAMGLLAEEIEELRGHLDRSLGGPVGATMLTLAELRLLPLLATHRSLPEIADQVGRSSNTIKTQAKSIYRKLEATSRSEAVDRARALGLLDAAAPNEVLTI
ncbi:MAG TPA: LuxR C-terminal-related transcriptional regulator, partial [Candidatus Limnocylindrales bacterium]|nr:LuxR C-terminal-related transcriptional regulator [Candidatus Limnocylindrales bacterium]